MATFPDLDYSTEGYGWTNEPDVIRTIYASKNTRNRYLFKNRDDKFSVTLKLTSDELSVFESFVLIDLNNGADEFTGTYFVGDSARAGTLQIENGVYNVSNLSPDFWSVSYNFYVRERPFADEEIIYEFVNEYNGFESFWDIMHATDLAINDNEL